jgi:hypothetical protein
MTQEPAQAPAHWLDSSLSSSLHPPQQLIYSRRVLPKSTTRPRNSTMLRTSIIKTARSVAAPRYFSVVARRYAEGSTGSGASRAGGSAAG